jgi:hypothetical protein
MATAINDPMRSKISLHGLGFIQVQLEGGQRLHVWHPALPRRACYEHSNIHNHRFGFQSRVLIGSLGNTMVRVAHKDFPGTPSNVQLKQYKDRYEHSSARTGNGGRGWDLMECVTALHYEMTVANAGQTYLMQPYEYHCSTPLGDGKVATVITKNRIGDEAASSLCTPGVTPDWDFDRFQLPESSLWEYVIEVLGAPKSIILMGEK